jgi:hypothetical protein
MGPFQIALAFMDALPRDELLDSLRARVSLYRLAAQRYEHNIRLKEMAGAPRHVAENLRLAAAQSEAAASWAEEVVGKVERGELP